MAVSLTNYSILDGGKVPSTLLGRMRNRMVKFFLRSIDKLIVRTKGGETAVFDLEMFEWIPKLKASYPKFRQEAEKLCQNMEALINFDNVDTRGKRSETEGGWKSLFFYVYGQKIKNTCRNYPELGGVENSVLPPVNLLVSVLRPGAHIKAHTGDYAGILRCHLGLIVKGDETLYRLRVRDKILNWKEGEALVFDNTCEHEAWNDSEYTRVILSLDFIRPLPFYLSGLNRLAISMIGRSGYVRQFVERWENHPF